MFGLYYLIRGVFVSLAAFGGAVPWQISPQTNLIAAFIFGIISTVGFAVFGRDVPLEQFEILDDRVEGAAISLVGVFTVVHIETDLAGFGTG